MQKKVCGDLYRRTVLCIDSYEDGIPTGRIFHPYLQNGIPFHGLTQFLVQMEELLNTMNYPQSFTTVRRFDDSIGSRFGTLADAESRQGELATFLIRILFRQNASWQGSVTWLEEEKSRSFRSVLELILLMDSALRGDAEAEDAFSA